MGSSGPGEKTQVDVVVWCTGFRPALDHLKALDVLDDYGRVEVDGGDVLFASRASGWSDMATGPGLASATLIGVTRTAQHS